MKKILQKQKLIPFPFVIVFTVIFLQLLFSTNINVPIAYGQTSVVGEIIYYNGYFLALNGNKTFGGPTCGVCLGGYWKYYSCGSKEKPKTCRKWICTLRRTGIGGTFTKDSACKTAYGSNVSAGRDLSYYTQIDICEMMTTKAHVTQCFITIPTPTPPLPISPPCVKWENGTCLKIGDISTEPAQFIVRILTIILSFAGGIALLLIISAGYKIMTSKGKPEAIQQGRDQLIAAIIGLVFIIFSFVIFQLIVVDIFKIPGIAK